METDADMNTVRHTVTEPDTDIVKHSIEQRLRPTWTWKRYRRESRTLPNTDMLGVRRKRTRTRLVIDVDADTVRNRWRS